MHAWGINVCTGGSKEAAPRLRRSFLRVGPMNRARRHNLSVGCRPCGHCCSNVPPNFWHFFTSNTQMTQICPQHNLKSKHYFMRACGLLCRCAKNQPSVMENLDSIRINASFVEKGRKIVKFSAPSWI